MTAATPSNQASILKSIWGPNINDSLYKRSKLVMKMSKDTNFGGDGRYVTIKIAGTAGGSSDYAIAVAAEAPTVTRRFFVTHKKEYQTFSIDGDIIARTRGNQNAMVEALKNEVMGARYMFDRQLAARAWGNQGGARAQLSASVTLGSTNMLLRNPVDIINFEVGMKLVFSTDDGTPASPAGVLDSGEQLTVVSVNKAAGIVVVSANLSTIASITVDCFVFRAGDYANAMTGIRGWNPTTAPGGTDSFFGVNRSTGDQQRQFGLIYDNGSSGYEDTIIDALAYAQTFGIEVTDFFVNPIDYAGIVKEVGAPKQVYVEDKKYTVGFPAIIINGPDGPVSVMSEPDVPKGYYWGNNPELLTLRTAGDCPMQMDEDTGKLLHKLEGSDSYRGSFGAYGNFFNENPGNSVQGAW